MTVLASWLDISINLLLFVFVVVCLLMSLIILMQRPKNEGLGAAFGSGTTDQLFGARTTNVLQKGTVYLSTLFFVITLTLAVLMMKRDSSRQTLVGDVPTVIEEVEKAPESIAPEAPVEPAPVETPAPSEAPAPAETPAAPEETTPAAPEAPPEETAPAEQAPAEETPAEPAPAEEP